MNTDIRSNPILDSPYFDLAGHVGSRAYCLDNIVYASGSDETSVLLDVGVRNLVPNPIPEPAVQPSHAFEIRKTPTGGFGMFAGQAIPAGALISVERPSLIAPYIIALQTHSESDLFTALLQRLTPSTASCVSALANCKPLQECDPLEGIIRTNAIAITLPVPANVPHPELPTHRAIFVNTSRCNHSCSPNAAWHWDISTFSLSLKALRPLSKGEEITVTYITPTYSRAERRVRLQAMYNFTCACAACGQPTSQSSDAARLELHSFWSSTTLPSFETWCLDGSLSDHLLIDAHKRAVELIATEGLEVLADYGKHLDAIAMGYGALKEVKLFREWAGRARNARADDAGVKVLQKWINEPETFPVWGWRKSLKSPRQS
ncbi:hypothetical protein FB45DRAFT_734866 [Roridomyces roridus]|uniref:SET domain-containing protein n=1 Tax=Roridomyces roridus TaxID=1738132 RepID=A0AAD7CEV3_9AGAR|nr:hypothetical protein FB45DRAFT_734866 [Roridomyces roridus]